MKEYIGMWKRAFDFSGVSSRKDYWMAFLFNVLIGIVLSFVLTLISPTAAYVVCGIYSLAALIPGLAIAVRRLHDINKSGFNLFMAFIPLVGCIILLVFLCTASVRANNKYDSAVA